MSEKDSDQGLQISVMKLFKNFHFTSLFSMSEQASISST